MISFENLESWHNVCTSKDSISTNLLIGCRLSYLRYFKEYFLKIKIKYSAKKENVLTFLYKTE